MSVVVPFLKWAGGKRWLVQRHRKLFPQKFNRYIEPFLGSGSVFFALCPEDGVISDCNSRLIETYCAIRDTPSLVEEKLEEHDRKHSTDYYYKVRLLKPRTPHARAARFVYLNRTCWNGLYRVNKQGGFNVPKGTKNKAILDTDNFGETASVLSKVKIENSDFEAVIDSAQACDFIFADPPYTVKHNKNNFVKYNEELFHWENQERLRDALVRAAGRGAYIMLTNAAHKSVRDLYDGQFEITILERKSVIASASANRGVYKEMLARTPYE